MVHGPAELDGGLGDGEGKVVDMLMASVELECAHGVLATEAGSVTGRNSPIDRVPGRSGEEEGGWRRDLACGRGRRGVDALAWERGKKRGGVR